MKSRRTLRGDRRNDLVRQGALALGFIIHAGGCGASGSGPSLEGAGAGGQDSGAGAGTGAASNADLSGLELGTSPCPEPSAGAGEPAVASFDAGGSAPSVLAHDGRRGSWFAFPDGVSLELTAPGASGSERALSLGAAVAPGKESGAGASLNSMGALNCAHNATAFSGVAFWVRSPDLTRVRFQVAQGWTTPVELGGTCLSDCYHHHWKEIDVTAEWTLVQIPWSELRSASWGQEVPFDARQLTQLVWGTPKDQAFTLFVDGVEFLSGGAQDVSVPPGYGPASAFPHAGDQCVPTSRVVDDFEAPDFSRERWWASGRGNGELERPLVTDSPRAGHAVRVHGSGHSSVTLARRLDDLGVCYTSAAGGVRFKADTEKARDLTLRIPLYDNTPVADGGGCAFDNAHCEENPGECCNDFHAATVRLTPGFQTYEVSFEDFLQSGFASALDLNFGAALRMEFELSDTSQVSVWLDDVAVTPADTGDATLQSPCQDSESGNVPFGSKPVAYTSGAALPGGVSDQAVRAAYGLWAGTYLRSACGGSIVDTSSDIGALTVSEAMGYGMLLTAFMNDKSAFDGLWRVTRSVPSPIVGEFMSWRLGDHCKPDGESSRASASDGDMDIAYALLLADRQWGSGGLVNYRREALDIVKSLGQWILSPQQTYIRLGDWAAGDVGYLGSVMRSSDFMPDHFRAFAELSGDARWDRARSNMYSMFRSLQQDTVGVVTDFFENADTSPNFPAGFVLENEADATYAVNACRVPFRIGVDYLMAGDPTAAAFLQKLSAWARNTTGGSPGQFVGKYWPDGGSLHADTWGALFYTGPLGVGAMAAGDQGFLDALWDYTRGSESRVYYQDTLRVLALIAMSGNWWSPQRIPCE